MQQALCKTVRFFSCARQLIRTALSTDATSCWSSYTCRTHTCGELRLKHVGDHVTLCGWVNKPRPLGVVFIPLSDSTGVTQLMCNEEKLTSIAKELKAGFVVKAEGVVIQRTKENVRGGPTGEIEVEVKSIEVLNETKGEYKHLSKSINVDKMSEVTILKHRHMYLRRDSSQYNLRLRSSIGMAIREFLIKHHGFVEVETPTLHRRTAMGAREFLVPTRDNGKFYSLVQSPQQFKQLLMVGGIDRYFQFARCYRDESQSPNKQPEFTQIDLEMSFVNEEGILRLTEEMMQAVFKECRLPFPTPSFPFPRLTYSEAMEKYGTDKPHIGLGMEFTDLSEQWREALSSCDASLPSESKKALLTVKLTGFRIPNWKSQYPAQHTLLNHLVPPDQHSAFLMADSSNMEVLPSPYSDGLSRALTEFCQADKTVKGLLHHLLMSTGGWNEEDGLMLAACNGTTLPLAMRTALGEARFAIGTAISKPDQQYRFVWVTGFPLFTIENDPIKGEVLTSTHHPFTAPVAEDEHLLADADNMQQLAKVHGQHYDLVCNGVELGGGSIRIHHHDLQHYILSSVLKCDTSSLSHLLNGLRSGCPPHGGIALGFDRLMALLCGAKNIREVIAFPKSYSGRDVLTGSPARVDPSELKEYRLAILKK